MRGTVYILVISIACLVLFLFTSCNANGNIEKFVSNQEKNIIESKGYSISDGRAYRFKWKDGKDYFSNEQVLNLTIQYSTELGRAEDCNKTAHYYLFSDDPKYMMNPNRDDLVKEYQAEGEEHEQNAAKIELQLKNLLETTEIPSESKGIWVVHSFDYKENLSSNGWNGPFEKAYLYLMDSNGKQAIDKWELSFASNIVGDFCQLMNLDVETELIRGDMVNITYKVVAVPQPSLSAQ